MKKIKKTLPIYVCGIDHQHEIGHNAEGNLMFYSIGSFKEYSKCYGSGCGIAEYEITFKKWVEEQDDKKMRDTSIPASQMTRRQIKDVKEKIKKYQKFLKKLETYRKQEIAENKKDKKKCQS